MNSSQRPISVPRFKAAKQAEEKLAMITAYDTLWASLMDAAGVDSILVGDSLGMVVQGHSTTLPVTLEEMIYHAKMVVRGTKRALVVVDLPFMTYQVSPQQALENAGRIIKETGASAVKLEGGVHQQETIQRLADAEIPVMAHVGMKPQSVHQLGGMGKIQRDEEHILADARAAEQAGAFAIVLELIPASIAKTVTNALSIPTIGIGAGPDCDGQVLVGPDMLGVTEGFHPKFLKHYAELGKLAREATEKYVEEVKSGVFPSQEHAHE